MPPFDGAPEAIDTAAVAGDRWKPDDPRWRTAADDLKLELGRFQRGMLSEADNRRVRGLLQTALGSGVILPGAADNARRLSTMAWSMVVIRFRSRQPAYPKNHEAQSLERFAELDRAWEAELLRELRSAAGSTLQRMGIRPRWEAVARALRRSSGPPPTGLRLAHRALVALADGAQVDFEPAITKTLTPQLEALLLQTVAIAGALKPLLRKRLLR